MKVAVGSKNPAKIAAVKQAFIAVFPDKRWEVEGIEAPSGVSNQPMSDKESIKGAKTRAKKALKLLQADFGVGIEGGLQKIGQNWFDCGWTVIVDNNGKEGIGSSVKMAVPKKMMRHIKQGIELGNVIDLVFKTKNAKHNIGHFGLMTKNTITRITGYRDGVIAALTRFVHPTLFEE